MFNIKYSICSMLKLARSSFSHLPDSVVQNINNHMVVALRNAVYKYNIITSFKYFLSIFKSRRKSVSVVCYEKNFLLSTIYQWMASLWVLYEFLRSSNCPKNIWNGNNLVFLNNNIIQISKLWCNTWLVQKNVNEHATFPSRMVGREKFKRGTTFGSAIGNMWFLWGPGEANRRTAPSNTYSSYACNMYV